MALTALCVLLAGGQSVHAQLRDIDFAALQLQGLDDGWTFKTGPNGATSYPISQLCGLRPSAARQVRASFHGITTTTAALPSRFDWRDSQGVTPIRNQGSCGACWAFATVGALECAIKIKTGVSVDLSEQWLVSCNQEDWSCNGGWFAHDYYLLSSDPCGGSGAVMEADFPYVAYKAPCACPYTHHYWIQSWGYVGDDASVPSADAIKQAIYDNGPVAVAITVDTPFYAYTGGVFNAGITGEVNHAVVLVGWDDAQGANGVWFLKNSWGTSWGESGFMRIEYGCANVGLGATYVVYQNTPSARTLTVASSNPGSGVSIAISPADTQGLSDGLTQFTRRYENGALVTLTAPLVASGDQRFVKWQKDGMDFIGNTSATTQVDMNVDHTMTAVYIIQRTLTVASAGLSSSIAVLADPPDRTGAGGGLTPFSRVYGDGTLVTLTAPASGGGSTVFIKWQRDGADFVNNTEPVTQVFMNADHALMAIYGNPPSTLTIASSNPDSGVAVAVVPADINGLGDGQTPFARIYRNQTAVTLTAPLMAGGNVFLKWRSDTTDISTQTTLQTIVTTTATLTAVYQTPDQTCYPLTVSTLAGGSGVSIAISPLDYRGGADGLTPFQRAYRSGTVATLTAPASYSDKGVSYCFRQWLLDGAVLSSELSAQVTMDGAHAVLAVYMPVASSGDCLLLATSANPDSGVPIAVNLADIHGEGDGTAPFTRTYSLAQQAVVTLTAPPKAGTDRFFRRWLLDGASFIGADQRAVRIPIGTSHFMTAVYETRSTCSLIVDSGGLEQGAMIGVSLPDLAGTQSGPTDLRLTYDLGAITTLTAPASIMNEGLPYVFSRWLRDGQEFTSGAASQIGIAMTQDAVMTAVYTTAWYEDYIIAYSDKDPARKFVYKKGRSVPAAAFADKIISENGIDLPYKGPWASGNLSLTPNRGALAGRGPRAIPGIKTAGAINRLFITGTMARKYAGAIEAAGTINSLTINGGCATDVKAAEIGSVRMTAPPQGQGPYLTAIHSYPPASPAPANGRQYLAANVMLTGVSLAEFYAPYQPASLAAQAKRRRGAAGAVCRCDLGLTTTSLQAAVISKLAATGGEIRFGSIVSRIPENATLAFYPKSRDVAMTGRLLTLSAENYPAHLLSREINVQAGLSIKLTGGDIGGPAAIGEAAFPMRIIAGEKIYSLCARADRRSGLGGFIGLRPPGGAASSPPAPAIAVIAGAGKAKSGLSDIAGVIGTAGANAWFYAGATGISHDPCVEPVPAYEGNFDIQACGQGANAICGAAFVSQNSERSLVERLRKLGNASSDFKINGKKLGDW
ncbi:MAG: C1 family peptidase [Candidatus Sumerlaeota bacterium]|nr:C1 family peptidase [Candidatus Sumerlaeota bacterium]